MANAVQDEAVRTPGKEARAMESFAHALRQLPTIIAENGGYDSAQLVSELRAAHKEGRNTMGLGNEFLGQFFPIVIVPLTAMLFFVKFCITVQSKHVLTTSLKRDHLLQKVRTIGFN